MSGEIKINFSADKEEFTRGTEELRKDLSKVETSLDDVNDTARRRSKQIEESFDDVADAAEDVGDSVDDAGTKAEDGLEKVGKGAEGLGGKLGDLGGVAKDALEGDLAGAAEGGLQALSGLAAAVPGIGALIGGALGTVAASLVSIWNEKAEETEKRISDMYQDMAESGNRFLSESFLQAALKDLWDDEGKIAEVKAAAEELGLSVSTVANAWVGVPDAVDLVRERAQALRDDFGVLTANEMDAVKPLIEIRDKMDQIAAETDNAVTRADGYKRSVGQLSNVWTEAGDAARKSVEGIPTEVEIVPTIDLEPVRRQIRELTSGEHIITFNQRYGRTVI